MALIAISFQLIADESQSIVYVDDDYDETTPQWNITCFNSIQDAIDAVAEGGKVIVYDGAYNENLIINKSVAIYGNGDVHIQSNSGNVIEINALNVILENLTIKGGYRGIYTIGDTTMINCSVNSNGIGIYVIGDNCKIYNCNVSNNEGYNIWIMGSNNIILDCYIGNSKYGIGIGEARYNKIYQCFIANHTENGIYFNESHFNLIEKCRIYNNGYGIYFFNSSHNKIFENEIKWNEHGVYFVPYDMPSNNNIIYHNNFISNIQQAYDECNNIWYNETLQEGNYWDDFDSPEEGAYDNDSNGIIDAPYEIEVGNSDLYPLANPFDLYPPFTETTVKGIMGNNGWYVSNVTVFLNATDNESNVIYINYSVDGVAKQGNESVVIELSDGIHEIEYYAVDSNGNEEKMKKLIIKVDTTPPSISYSLNPSSPNGKNGWYTSSVEISLSAEDESGIDELNYKIGAGGWEDYTGFFFISVDGIHDVFFRAIDMAGNEKIINITLKIDQLPPEINIERPSNEYVKGIFSILWNASDDVDKDLDGNISIFYSHDNGTSWVEIATNINNTGNFVWNSYGFKDSKNAMIKIEAEDDAGNVGNATTSFILDNLPPVVIIDEPSEGRCYGLDEYGNILIDVIWEAYDDVDDDLNGAISIEYYDGSWHTLISNHSNTGRYTFNAKDWEDGKYKIKVSAVDDAGNVGMAITGNFTIDKKPPFIYVSRPLKGYIYINLFGREIIPPVPMIALPYDAIIIGKITVEVSASDTHSGIQRVEIKAGEDSYVDYAPPYKFEWNPSLGVCSLEATAYDNAGNSASYKLEKILCINV